MFVSFFSLAKTIEKNVGCEPQPLSSSCSFPFDAWIKESKKRWLPQKYVLQDLQHSFCVYCSPASSKPTKALWDNQVKSIVEMCFFNKNPLYNLQIRASVMCPRACCLHTGRPQTSFASHITKSCPKCSPLHLHYFRCLKSLSQRSNFFSPPAHVFAFFQVIYHLVILFSCFQSLDRCIPRTGRNAGRIDVSIT